MIDFFFYHNLKNTELLNQLKLHYKMNDSYIYISDYENSNNIIINEKDHNENKIKLTGRYVNFYNENNLDNIIKNIIDLNIGNENKKYKIIQYECFLEHTNDKKEVYLII